MAKTAVGLFEDFNSLEIVTRELINNGIPRDRLSFIGNNIKGEYNMLLGGGSNRNLSGGTGLSGDRATGAATATGGLSGFYSDVTTVNAPGIGQVCAAGPVVSSNRTGFSSNLIDIFGNLGIPRKDAELYLEGVRRGGSLLIATLDDKLAERAHDIMQRHGAIDIHQRLGLWKQRGYTGFNQNASVFTADQIDQERAFFRAGSFERGQVAVPVVEEQVVVGKREVEKGGVRVSSHVVEQPVNEQLNLREERVSVERKPVDKPMAGAGAAPFKEGVIEVREMAEEAVVNKQARVVEEVLIRKDVEQRPQGVQDTVRRTEVDVQPLGSGIRGYDSYSADFRKNYDSLYANRGQGYDYYEPAYRYGYNLASDKRYSGRDWSAIEADARRDWESQNKGTWEQFKDSVRYAWDRARAKV